MCGRITLRMPARAVAEFLRRNLSSIPEPRFNIGPGQESLVVRISGDDPEERELCSMNWNFVSSWNREEKPASIINARSETVGERPSFRSAFRNRRALLLADGFYEWKRQDGERLPYFCALKEDEPFAIAAIWEEWKRDGKAETGFCLLTTEPNELMKPIHNRMPVLLDRAGADLWLSAGFKENLEELFRPFPAEKMTARPVDTYVNKIGNEGPKCIESATEGDEQLSLF